MIGHTASAGGRSAALGMLSHAQDTTGDAAGDRRRDVPAACPIRQSSGVSLATQGQITIPPDLGLGDRRSVYELLLAFCRLGAKLEPTN
jgi:hypothetical protein